MKLSEDNIEEWKKELDKLMLEKIDFPNYSEIYSDKEWLQDWIEETPEYVFEEELSYWKGDF
jgi:hypothetical protein